MTETKIYCDHCGAELNQMKDYTNYDMDTVKDFVNCDLCEDCVEALDKMIKKFLNKEEK